MIKVCLLCPHTKISGGVKVIFTLASYLSRSGLFDVTVGARKHNDKLMTWFDYPINFEIKEYTFENKHCFEDFDIVVNYLDGGTNIEKGKQTKHILFLQGFGTQNIAAETTNLKFPFDAVIVTSKWLLDMAINFGHSKVFLTPPAVDHKFSCVRTNAPKIPIIGALYHKSPQKNFSLFEATMQNLVIKRRTFIRPLVLGSKHPEMDLALQQAAIPTTIIVDPPQILMPTLYSMCSVWFATSANEGFGLPPLEAMACGCPVVIYPNSGLREIAVNNYNCLFAKNKIEAANAIENILKNGDMRKELVKNGFETAAKFTWENSAKIFSDVLLMLKGS